MKKVFIIAEAGVNHNGSLILAKKLVRAAADSGADAVKFQTFKAESLVTEQTPQAKYQQVNMGRKTSQYAMLKKLELSHVAHIELAKYAQQIGIMFMSTAFDDTSLAFLTSKFKLPYLKVPSGEITNAPFLLLTSKQNLPIILSTGMSTLAEIREALGVLAFGFMHKKNAKPGIKAFRSAYASREGQDLLKKNVTILHCVSEYPTPVDQVNLNVIPALQKEFGVSVGFSDHTLGVFAPVAAVALGAKIIEKHLTLSRKLPGVDHRASLEPQEFKQMVAGVRKTEKMLGIALKRPQPCEIKNIPIVRKRLVAGSSIAKNEFFSADNVVAKRSLRGALPVQFWNITGLKSKRAYKKDEAIL